VGFIFNPEWFYVLPLDDDLVNDRDTVVPSDKFDKLSERSIPFYSQPVGIPICVVQRYVHGLGYAIQKACSNFPRTEPLRISCDFAGMVEMLLGCLGKLILRLADSGYHIYFVASPPWNNLDHLYGA
jgi:hypothetical protein